MKTLTILFVLAFSLMPCHAQSLPELKQQAHARFEKADKEMNAAYKLLVSSLNEDGKSRLKASQRAWLKFRDAQANFDCHHFSGGTAEGLERLGSLHLLTQARTKRLLADYKRFKEING